MGAIPQEIDPAQAPPLRLPLQHFLIGLGFLVGAGIFLVGWSIARIPHLAPIHSLLVGWIVITIMGALTQFIPVWSGTTVYSERLSRIALATVTIGLLLFVVSFVAVGGVIRIFGAVLLLIGFSVFTFSIGRMLMGVRPWDITERHFALALCFLLLTASMGFILAIGMRWPLFDRVPITQATLMMSHATIALFGVVLTTVMGALYQLAPMFTQSELDWYDSIIRRIVEVTLPTGILALAFGRLVMVESIAIVGGTFLTVSVLGIGIYVLRRVLTASVSWSPMLIRYAAVGLACLGWVALTLPVWLDSPLAPTYLYGGPGAFYLLVLGIFSFVVMGTLYHIIPFIIWLERYSDDLGLRPVPMIDDLYDDRLSHLDFGLFLVGTVILVGSDLFGWAVPIQVAGSIVVLGGMLVFGANMLLVVHRHAHSGIFGVFGRPFKPDRESSGRTMIEK